MSVEANALLGVVVTSLCLLWVGGWYALFRYFEMGTEDD